MLKSHSQSQPCFKETSGAGGLQTKALSSLKGLPVQAESRAVNKF